MFTNLVIGCYRMLSIIWGLRSCKYATSPGIGVQDWAPSPIGVISRLPKSMAGKMTLVTLVTLGGCGCLSTYILFGGLLLVGQPVCFTL